MNPNNNKNRLVSLLLCAALIVSVFVMVNSLTKNDTPYSKIVDQFLSHKVNEFKLNISTGKLTYKLTGDTKIYTYNVPDVGLFISDIEEYINYVNEYNKTHENSPILYTYEAPSYLQTLLVNGIPMLLVAAVGIFFLVMMSRQNNESGRVNKFIKSKVKDTSSRDTTFDQVAGADEEKAELEEIVEFLKHPAQFNALGGKVPKGVLLVGPPGTGKTLLARAVAGEAGVPFYSISGSDFVEVYVGVGASRVRDLFDKAKKTAPSIIFIDEIDAVGRQRGAGLGGGHDEREQTLNQLLVEMDGFEANSGVIVMAATNRADILDGALTRSGRFDRQIYVNVPDVKGREEILKVHSRNKPLAPDVDLRIIAKSTPGFTGADLENILNEAALAAAKQKRKAITMKDINDATTKVMMGPEKRSRVMTEKDRRLTAYHETGHAIAVFYAAPENEVHEVSIIPRGSAGGYTMPLPKEDLTYTTKSEMLNDICVSLAGRVAEQLKMGDVSTGASSDLQKVTSTARAMVTKYGFSKRLGLVVYGSGHDEVFLGRDFAQNRSYSEEYANLIDEEVKAIVDEQYRRCEALLREHDDKLELIAHTLLEYDRIDGKTFQKLMSSDATAVTAALPADVSPTAEKTDEVPASGDAAPEEDTAR